MAATTALIIMGLAQAGSAIAKAKMESNAANKATTAMTGAADQAMGLNKQVMNQQQMNMNPYMQMGGQAAAQLGALMTPQGQPGAYNPSKPPTFQLPQPNQLTPFSPGLSNGTVPFSLGSPMQGTQVRQPQLPKPMSPGGATPRMRSGQPLNPYSMTVN